MIINHNDSFELQQHSEENPFIEILLDKLLNITYLYDLENILINDKIKGYCNPRTIILCNLNDVDCNSRLGNSGLLYFNLNNLNKWEFFNDIIYSKSLKVSCDSNIPNEYKFIEWSNITKFVKFCNSVIIFDKYIFCDKSNQKIQDNLFLFLENLLQLNNRHFQITIISEFDKDDIITHHQRTNSYLISKGITNFDLNLVHHTKALYPRNFEGLHSRFILTNYLHILANDSFNFFKQKRRYILFT